MITEKGKPVKGFGRDTVLARCDEIAARGGRAAVTWLHFTAMFGKSVDLRVGQIVKTCLNAQIGGRYDDIVWVSLRKALEDAKAGGRKDRRASSYVHDRERPYIVYGKGRTADPKPLLQVLLPEAPIWYTKYYVDGREISPDDPMARAMKALCPPSKGEIGEVFCISLSKVLNVMPACGGDGKGGE